MIGRIDLVYDSTCVYMIKFCI